ncbi:MAG: flagellar hook-basal body complex protein FliE [Nitrospirae bacterium]|nr:MAG: flagellar hook-basal body complex protein FliE [Nitrospirota bacterium]
MDITALTHLRALAAPDLEGRPGHLEAAAPSQGPGFAEVLEESLEQVSRLEHDAQAAAERLVSGKGGEIHEVMIRMKEAQVAFEMVLAVRNKAIEAYQEVMRMQV